MNMEKKKYVYPFVEVRDVFTYEMMRFTNPSIGEDAAEPEHIVSKHRTKVF